MVDTVIKTRDPVLQDLLQIQPGPTDQTDYAIENHEFNIFIKVDKYLKNFNIGSPDRTEAILQLLETQDPYVLADACYFLYREFRDIQPKALYFAIQAYVCSLDFATYGNHIYLGEVDEPLNSHPTQNDIQNASDTRYSSFYETADLAIEKILAPGMIDKLPTGHQLAIYFLSKGLQFNQLVKSFFERISLEQHFELIIEHIEGDRYFSEKGPLSFETLMEIYHRCPELQTQITQLIFKYLEENRDPELLKRILEFFFKNINKI